MSDQGAITRLVNKLGAGELLSHDDLFPVVYAELRGMAQHRLQRESGAVPATELVHQVYVKLFGGLNGNAKSVRWECRAHFFGAAARAMEQLLIDSARRRRTRRELKDAPAQSGDASGFDLDALTGELQGGDMTGKVDVLTLAEALRELAAQDAALAELVRLRVYLGQPIDVVATTLNISARTVSRDWALARAWLLRRMRDMETSTGDAAGDVAKGRNGTSK
ncbi:MAG: ECF-type sigma factor [Planctomycetota bacterium]